MQRRTSTSLPIHFPDEEPGHELGCHAGCPRWRTAVVACTVEHRPALRSVTPKLENTASIRQRPLKSGEKL